MHLKQQTDGGLLDYCHWSFEY